MYKEHIHKQKYVSWGVEPYQLWSFLCVKNSDQTNRKKPIRAMVPYRLAMVCM